MTSLTPSPVKEFAENSLEKQVYKLVESFSGFLPIQSDRYRLSFCLLKYLNGEGDKPKVLVKTQKMKITGISMSDLAAKIDDGLKNIQK